MGSNEDGTGGGEAITAGGLRDLKAELEELEGPGRRRMAERIKAARELGDLKENADYHIAKEDQAHLETKIKRLRARLREAVVVDVGDDGDHFAFGRTAEVADDAGTVHTWTLVGPTEADMSAGRLSAESPVGSALRDARVGADVVVETPRGNRTFTIRKLVG
ncbi:MAG TPA: transcription elongation factor GreA [Solirubrobacterales bacterium]|nr:transcription elongation factor GreA [Solirubrobacterales bacterium]